MHYLITPPGGQGGVLTEALQIDPRTSEASKGHFGSFYGSAPLACKIMAVSASTSCPASSITQQSKEVSGLCLAYREG